MINKELKFNFYQIPFGDLSLVQKSQMHHARNESSYVAQKLPKFVAISAGEEWNSALYEIQFIIDLDQNDFGRN